MRAILKRNKSKRRREGRSTIMILRHQSSGNKGREQLGWLRRSRLKRQGRNARGERRTSYSISADRSRLDRKKKDGISPPPLVNRMRRKWLDLSRRGRRAEMAPGSGAMIANMEGIYETN